MLHDKNLSISQEERLVLEHLNMFEHMTKTLAGISKNNLQRLILLLICPQTKEKTYLERIKDKKAKAAYTLATRCASIRYAQIFKQVVEQERQKESTQTKEGE